MHTPIPTHNPYGGPVCGYMAARGCIYRTGNSVFKPVTSPAPAGSFPPAPPFSTERT